MIANGPPPSCIDPDLTDSRPKPQLKRPSTDYAIALGSLLTTPTTTAEDHATTQALVWGTSTRSRCGETVVDYIYGLSTLARPDNSRPRIGARQADMVGEGVGDDDNAKTALETLITEAQDLGKAITHLSNSVERFIAITGSTTGVGLTLGLFQRQYAILIALPIALSILYIYVIQIYTDAAVLAGQKKYVEMVVNDMLGMDVLLSRSVQRRHQTRPSPFMSSILALVVLLLLAVTSIWATFHYYHGNGHLLWLLQTTNISLLSLALVTIAQATREYLGAEKHAYEDAARSDLLAKLRGNDVAATE